MSKRITLSFIFSLIIFGIGIAIKSFARYFNGYGIPFVAVLVMALLFVTYGIMSADSRRRLWDLLVLNVISVLLGLILFCVFEWALEPTIRLYDFVNVFANVYSVLSLIFFVYTIVRLMFEINGKTFIATEFVLASKKSNTDNSSKREYKQPKEVRLGDVEQKPINQSKAVEQTSQEEKAVEETEINQNIE